jgi:DNA polymerase I-like protein with 3'-5' exonuclease and polymerase domains
MKSIRETFLPDEGCLFVRVDLSQVEDRVCKMYTRADRMVELANRHPEEYDAHTENAKAIFAKKRVTKDERYLGKKAVHASQRGMRGDKLSESIMHDTKGEVFVHPKRCQAMIDRYLEANWEIRDIYFPWVRQKIIGEGVLVNSWGRRWDVRGFKVDDDLLRRGYSFYMQSECADWTNQYGFLPAWRWLKSELGKVPNAQVHDEIIASLPQKSLWDYAQFITEAIEQTREMPVGSGNYLKVPAEITVGTSWYGGVEFKRLLGREEFYEMVKEKLEL